MDLTRETTEDLERQRQWCGELFEVYNWRSFNWNWSHMKKKDRSKKKTGCLVIKLAKELKNCDITIMTAVTDFMTRIRTEATTLSNIFGWKAKPAVSRNNRTQTFWLCVGGLSLLEKLTVLSNQSVMINNHSYADSTSTHPATTASSHHRFYNRHTGVKQGWKKKSGLSSYLGVSIRKADCRWPNERRNSSWFVLGNN